MGLLEAGRWSLFDCVLCGEECAVPGVLGKDIGSATRSVRNLTAMVRRMPDEHNALLSAQAKETGTAQQDGEYMTL